MLYLLQIAKDNDIQLMKVVLAQVSPSRAKAWLNEKDRDFNIPLHYSARYNYLEMTKVLVDMGSGL